MYNLRADVSLLDSFAYLGKYTLEFIQNEQVTTEFGGTYKTTCDSLSGSG